MGLTFHYAKRDFDVYALVVAKGGPKFKQAPDEHVGPPVAVGRKLGEPPLDSDGLPELPTEN
jgi:uncharacterized protein (TIGR03435 family)